MGNTYVPIKMMLEELKIDVICPPRCNKRTLHLGSKCSPEGICVPFKLNMGNYIEGIEKGADTVFMLTGCGPCRFGVFSALQQEIIHDLGHDVTFLTSDRFSSIAGFKEFITTIHQASGQVTYLKIMQTIKRAYSILKMVDALHDKTNFVRPREIKKGQVDQIYQAFFDQIPNIHGYYETRQLIQDTMKLLDDLPIDRNREVIKIGLIGEIYTVIETFINLNMERKLGEMGVEVVRSISTFEFIKEQMEFLPFIKSEKDVIHRAAHDYLQTPVGGHGIHTIGNMVRYHKQGYDGVIHILPFTCMPEIVARSITPTVEQDLDMPLLTLVIDEMTGEAGYDTRLEAFVDLLHRRKEMRLDGTKHLSWN
jgi:predicted nucleotide-binding protein (sugar kinase/HSP70/actin superfamily)